ncbi:MAG TPA: exostosin family protein [Solirubrobacteraceae bacterium]|jgi:hypothetical protein
MLVHLARLNDPYLDQPVASFAMHAATDKVRAHRLTDSPGSADVILFTQCHMLQNDWRLKRLTRHPLARAFPQKAMVYNELDRPWCALPGVYVNMPRRHFAPQHQRAWGYFTPPPGERAQAPDLLFSLVASNTSPCRRPLFALQHADAIVEEVHGFRFWDSTSELFEARRANFQTTLARSRFVLCPRGNGTSSVRLYEALAIGAVPVIIADDWLPPPGPAWEQFSIRWPEGKIDGLLQMLEARDADWPQLSREARRAYEEHFSPDVYFHHVASLCEDLLAHRSATAFRAHLDRYALELAARSASDRVKYTSIAARERAKRFVRGAVTHPRPGRD